MKMVTSRGFLVAVRCRAEFELLDDFIRDTRNQHEQSRSESDHFGQVLLRNLITFCE